MAQHGTAPLSYLHPKEQLLTGVVRRPDTYRIQTVVLDELGLLELELGLSDECQPHHLGVHLVLEVEVFDGLEVCDVM